MAALIATLINITMNILFAAGAQLRSASIKTELPQPSLFNTGVLPTRASSPLPPAPAATAPSLPPPIPASTWDINTYINATVLFLLVCLNFLVLFCLFFVANQFGEAKWSVRRQTRCTDHVTTTTNILVNHIRSLRGGLLSVLANAVLGLADSLTMLAAALDETKAEHAALAAQVQQQETRLDMQTSCLAELAARTSNSSSSARSCPRDTNNLLPSPIPPPRRSPGQQLQTTLRLYLWRWPRRGP